MLPVTDSAEYAHNVEHSRLHNLPLELFLNIVEDPSFSTATTLVLRFVARDFHRLVRQPLTVEADDRKSFKELLERDKHVWHSRWEPAADLQNLRYAVCSACDTLHTKGQFGADDLHVEAGERICIGARESILVFNGGNLTKKATLNEIRALAPGPAKALKRTFISRSAPAQPDEELKRPFLESVRGHIIAHEELHLLCQYQLLRIPRIKPVQQHMLLDALELCAPTVASQLQNATIINRIVDFIITSKDVWKRPSYREVPGTEGQPYPWYGCSGWAGYETMNPSFALHRRKSEHKTGWDEVALTIYAMYEPPAGSADPSWSDAVTRYFMQTHENFNKGLDTESVMLKCWAINQGEWNWSPPAAESQEKTEALFKEMLGYHGF